MPELTPAALEAFRSVLTRFNRRVVEYLACVGNQPVAGSIALAEAASFVRPKSVVTAWSQATQLIESSGDHLTGFVKLISNPVESIACHTCVRSMLEPCAIAAWLLDPDLDVKTRVGRSLALRYEGLDQQLKFARAAGGDEAAIERSLRHIDEVEQIAAHIGYQPIKDRNGKRSGIGERWPGTTALIDKTLDAGSMYRLLSAIAHGHSWAMIQLSFKRTASSNIGDVPVGTMERHLTYDGIDALTVYVAKSFAKPLWFQCRYYGWNQDRMAAILDEVSDFWDVPIESRYWRITPDSPL